MEKLLISACLLGVNCKYNGGNNRLPDAKITVLRQHYELVPVCPETAGGLPTPRVPSERRIDGVWSRDGRDVSAAFAKGAAAALALARKQGCRKALLKERSPSCGSGTIYDGSFSGRLVRGDGVTAELLRNEGIAVCGETGMESFLKTTE